MSAATGLSRITGFIRTLVQASTLGTGAVAGAYAFSNTLPNQIYELFMGGLLSSIFIPILVERMTKSGEEDARRLADALLTAILPLLAVIVALAIVLAGPLVRLTSDWTDPETTGLAILMFRVFAFQILFYGISSLATGILNAHRRFFLPTFAPVLNNLTVIAAFALYALLATSSPRLAVYVLACGTTLGVTVMSCVLLPPVFRLGYRPNLRVGHPALASAARLAGPMVIFVAAAVGLQVVANYLGSRFDGVANLWYAFIIFSLPYGLFVVAIATALMPELSEHHARGNLEGYRSTLSFGLRTMAFIIVPASVGMVALAEPIVRLLMERGAFGAEDTASVATLLAAYGAGLLPYGAYFVLIRSFYALQNTKVPAALNVGLFGFYSLLAFLLSEVLGLIGVALAFSGAYAVLSILCLAAMRREIKRLDGRRLLISLAKILAAGAAMYLVGAGAAALLGAGSNLFEHVLVLVLAGGTSVAAYLGVALLLKTAELRSAIALLRRRVSPAAENAESPPGT